MERQRLEQKFLLRRELTKRKEGDPLYTFELHQKQKDFVNAVLTRSKPENWFIAANRSGKSDAGAFVGSKLAREGRTVPTVSRTSKGKVQVKSYATAGWVVSLDFPSSRDIIQPKYFDNGFSGPDSSHEPFIPDREIADWSVSNQILRLKNGSIIGFKSADSGRKKFQGTEKDWLQFDEEPPKEIYEECIIRVGQRPLDVFGTCTLLPPEGLLGGVTWLYTDIIEPFVNGTLAHANVFGASIYDNPHISRDEIARLEAIYPEGSVQRRIRLGGEWLPGLSGARAYTSFDRRLHVRPQGDLIRRRPIAWMFDFNVDPMISLIGQLHRGRTDVFRFFKELVLDEGSIPEMAEWFRHIVPHHLAEIHIYGDSTGNTRTAQTGETDYRILLNSMRTYGVPVRLKVPTINPAVPDRINAVNYALKDSQGAVHVEIDPSCEEFIKDLENVLRDPRGGIKKTSNRKDPYYRRTHASDAGGYWISYEAPVRTLRAPGIGISRPVGLGGGLASSAPKYRTQKWGRT